MIFLDTQYFIYLVQESGGKINMDIEIAFIKCSKEKMVVDIVDDRLNGPIKDLQNYFEIEVPDSYDTILKNDNKRKIAISNNINGWITLIESKEVNDYVLLMKISEEINTEVFAIVQSDIIGAWGYVDFNKGKVVDSYFSEDDEDIELLIESKMKERNIDNDICMFREVVLKKDSGWEIIQTKKSKLKI